MNQLEKYAQAKALVDAMSNSLEPQQTHTNPELTLLLEANNRWTQPTKFSNDETTTGLSSRFVTGISSVKNTANTIVKKRLKFFNDLFEFNGTPKNKATNDIEQQMLGFLKTSTLDLQSFNDFFENHKKNFKNRYGLTDDLSTKAAIFNLLCAKKPVQRDSLLAIAKEMNYVDQIHIFHICTFPNITSEYQPNAANYFENHMFCTPPQTIELNHQQKLSQYQPNN